MELRRDRCIEQTPEMPRKDAGYSGGYQIDLGANLEAEETLPQLSSLSRGKYLFMSSLLTLAHR